MAIIATADRPHLVHVLRRDVTFATPGISEGYGVSLGKIPRGAMVTAVKALITQAWNAETDGAIRLGPATDMVTWSSFFDEATPDFYSLPDPDAVSVVAADVEYFIKYEYDPGGAAPTTGAGVFLIEYVISPTIAS